MFGIKDFSAIINPPQTAILAIGTGREILGTFLKFRITINNTTYYQSNIASLQNFACFFRRISKEVHQDDRDVILRQESDRRGSSRRVPLCLAGDAARPVVPRRRASSVAKTATTRMT